MNSIKRSGADSGAQGQILPKFLDGFQSALRSATLRIAAHTAIWLGLCSVGLAQSANLSPADTFVHAHRVPIFEVENGWMPPSSQVATIRLTAFPPVHVRKLTLICTFAPQLAAGAQFAVGISTSQPFPERFNLVWQVVDGRLIVQITSPPDLDLQPDAILKISWEAANPSLPQQNAIRKVDGILIVDNIDGFRALWLPPNRWLEKGEH